MSIMFPVFFVPFFLFILWVQESIINRETNIVTPFYSFMRNSWMEAPRSRSTRKSLSP